MSDARPMVLWQALLEPDIAASGVDQCDCACPEGALALQPHAMGSTAPLRQAPVHRQRLDDEWALMFNPLHNAGVNLVNASMQTLWEQFAVAQAPQALSLSGELQTCVAQLVERGLLEPTGAATTWSRSAPEHLSVWMHVTNRCNLRCGYCYLHKTADQMDEPTGRTAIDAIWKSAQRHQIRGVKLKFAGGEPTLALRTVFALHDYAQSKAGQTGIELESALLTNGVALSKRTIDGLLQRGMRVSISLDGIGDQHDGQRAFADGRGSFAYVAASIQRLLDNELRPFVNITVSARSADGLAEVVAFVLEHNLPFNLNFYRDNECAAPNDGLRLQDAKIVDAISCAFAVISAQLPERSLLGSLVDRAQFDHPHDRACGVGDSYMVIAPGGAVARCQMDMAQPVTTIWCDDVLDAVRAEHAGLRNLSVDARDGCRSCSWRYYCGGGCPALTFHAAGRYDTSSPYCDVYQAIYPALIRLEGLRLLQLARIKHLA